MKKALEGIKVVDLTSALSGPFCTMMLADYGADVLKIEPLHGDQCRTWGPIDEKSGESGFYCYVNRNKKGATLNLKSEKGKQMFYDLVKDADIPLVDAVRMATLTPAGVVGIEQDCGSIAIGKRADFCIMDKNLEVSETIVEGKTVFRKDRDGRDKNSEQSYL